MQELSALRGATREATEASSGTLAHLGAAKQLNVSRGHAKPVYYGVHSFLQAGPCQILLKKGASDSTGVQHEQLCAQAS